MPSPRAAEKARGLTPEELAGLIARLIEQAISKSAKHLTTEGLADRYDVSPRTVADWRLDKKGPPYLEDPVRYPLAWVEEWELSHRVEPASA
jgi:hypothetical protein